MQEFVSAAPVVCALTCSLDRVQWRYGARAYRSAHLDAGVMCQNLYLVGTALDLCVCAVFGFFEDRLQQLLHLDDDREYPTLLFTIGHPNLELTAP
jgi:SagB-type dehydrogenase family enzyme